jgi:hypothetical protein
MGELTQHQINILAIFNTCMTLQGNIKFFSLMNAQQAQTGMAVNIDALNQTLAVLLSLKNLSPEGEYELLLTLDPMFKEFDKIFLQEKVEVEQPKPKSQIILLGD